MQVPLSQGLVAVIDDSDAPIVEPHRWCARRTDKKIYAVSTQGGRTTYMHRLVMGEPKAEVDHVDGDGLNNRRSNLRTATRQQNAVNSGPRAGKFKGTDVSGTSARSPPLRKRLERTTKRHSPLGATERSSTSQGGRAIQVCKQRQDVANSHVDFPSKSRPDKPPYRVYAFRPDTLPMCTCMPFLTSRKKAMNADNNRRGGIEHYLGSCQHIKKVHADTCQWDEGQGGASIHGTCPLCGGSTVDVDEHWQPTAVATDADDAVAAILRTQAKLRGEEPPEPTPKAVKPVRPAMRVVLEHGPADRMWTVVINGHDVIGLIDGPDDSDDPTICVYDAQGEAVATFRLNELVDEVDSSELVSSLVAGLKG